MFLSYLFYDQLEKEDLFVGLLHKQIISSQPFVVLACIFLADFLTISTKLFFFSENKKLELKTLCRYLKVLLDCFLLFPRSLVTLKFFHPSFTFLAYLCLCL
uniref:Uncharacterized protein n=1 Tax=Physcomitrium patens TaxID=3218 RepID=A0A2K1L9G8_PHYPA|nr:hypothetical protein PHYPA_001099 [Physcomitrium patens]